MYRSIVMIVTWHQNDFVTKVEFCVDNGHHRLLIGINIFREIEYCISTNRGWISSNEGGIAKLASYIKPAQRILSKWYSIYMHTHTVSIPYTVYMKCSHQGLQSTRSFMCSFYFTLCYRLNVKCRNCFYADSLKGKLTELLKDSY